MALYLSANRRQESPPAIRNFGILLFYKTLLIDELQRRPQLLRKERVGGDILQCRRTADVLVCLIQGEDRVNVACHGTADLPADNRILTILR